MDEHTDPIAQRAAELFARRNQATPAERGAREAWLAADPRHLRAYDDARRLWERTGALREDVDLQALKFSDMAAMQRSHWLNPRRMLAVAAALLLLVGSGYVARLVLSAPPAASFVTAVGERRVETLADGTEMVLNTGSQVQARYTRNQRVIELLQGEVQFEVTRDTARPFVVQVGEGTVTALGTRFQVRREPAQTRVTLLEGSVQVENAGQRRELEPRQQARLSPEGDIAISQIDPEMAAGWVAGWLRFRNTRLSEVVVEANRYSDRRLRLGDPELADMQISGNFHVGDNVSMASAFEQILPVRAERDGTDIVLVPQ